MSVSHIDAYLFDLGHVLVHIHFDRFLHKLGLDSKLSVEEALNRYLRSDLMVKYESGIMTTKEFVAASGEVLNFRMDEPAFEPAWRAIIGDEIAGMYEIVHSASLLKPVYLLSNTNEPHFDEALSKAPSLRLFRKWFLSYEMGLVKPDPEIYIETARRMEIEPGKIVFIDDRSDNIEAAAKVGFQTIQFKEVGQVRTALGF